MLKPTIPFSDFARMDLRTGKVIEVSEIENSENLVRLTVDLGEEIGQRNILAGIKNIYPTKTLKGKLIVVLVNWNNY